MSYRSDIPLFGILLILYMDHFPKFLNSNYSVGTVISPVSSAISFDYETVSLQVINIINPGKPKFLKHF